MRVRKMTASGDYSFGNNQLDFYKDTPEAVGQNVQTSLLLWLGEWYLNTDLGTPYMQGILGKYSQEVANTTIQDQILNVDGVTNISDFQSIIDPDTRSLSVTCSIDTIFGPTQVQVANYANY